MTDDGEERLGDLERLGALARRRPDLAGPIEAHLEELARLQPASAEPQLERAAGAIEQLRHLGVVDAGRADHPPGARLASRIAHRALEFGAAADFEAPRLLVGNAVVELAEALGRAFEPEPLVLLRIFSEIPEGEWDFREQVAWLAARQGGEALVAGLGDAVANHPDLVLDFLRALSKAEFHGPYRGTGPPTGEVPVAREGAAQQPAEPPPSWAPPVPHGIERPERPPLPPVGRAPAPTRGRGGVRGWMRWAAEAVRGRTRALPPEPPARQSRPAPESPPSPRPAVVSTGFAATPGGPGLARDRTLATNRRYQFFVEIGPDLTADAVDTAATPLPELAAGSVLQVVLFGFDDELAPEPGADVGELRLVGDGTAIVESQPGGTRPGQRRLHLPVTTPDRTGPARMRCNLYCRQVLLQSRLVEVQVTDEEEAGADPGLRSVLDFGVVSELCPEQVDGLRSRALSLMVNDNGNGTHGFRFFAGSDFKADATLTGHQLNQLLDQARSSLRLASWSTGTEPTREQFSTLAYRYSNPGPTTLADDLALLARSGYIVWDELIYQLGGSRADDLVERMRAPGVVELANRQSLDLLVPAACLYDHPLNPEDATLAICPTFEAARGTTPLHETPCFEGECPSYGDPTVVCPSGFWGFRHQIGYSASLTGGEAGDARDQALAIPAGAAPVFTAGASTDSSLLKRDAHLRRVRALAGDHWHFAASRTELFSLFRTVAPSVVYLYGHGGRQGRAAFFEVGSGQDGPIIRASLRGKADWRSTRPLVFLNGCHSAALAPDAAFSYATGFLQTAHASAVVGTEIAVFESLATAFAEDCLRRFVAERQPLGQAVRGARLALLEQGVPLGLVYLAFGPSELHLAA